MTPAGRPRVLVVDDEASLLELLEKYLVRLGYEVDACGGGPEAWRRFEQDPRRYALVMADLSLPEMSGAELAGKMLISNPEVRILVCSGYPFETASVSGAAETRIGFLQKPFLPRMLTEAIRELMER